MANHRKPFAGAGIGARFGEWTVTSAQRFVDGRWEADCACSCGAIRTITIYLLRYGGSKSCGCSRKGKIATHGLSNTPEHDIWMGMRARCQNPNRESFSRYGGRGIKVCAEWGDFANFLRDMGPRPTPRHSVDRIDNDGNYEPGNCRWALQPEQMKNSSRAHQLTANGETLCLGDWAARLGMSGTAILSRIRNGWPEHLAVTLAPMSKRDAMRAVADFKKVANAS